MRFRKLRIAWSVFWGLACVLLIVLWVRSYWRCEFLVIPGTNWQKDVKISSAGGHLGICMWRGPEWWKLVKFTRVVFVPGFGYTIPGEAGYYDGEGKPIGVHQYELIRFPHVESLPFSTISGQDANSPLFSFGRHLLGVPHWFCVIAFTSIAATPWIRWRFSLRTLLIATTLVAVMLGLVVYAT